MYKFKNYRCNKFGSINNIHLEEMNSQKLLKNQLRVKVLAIGLNYVDVLMIKGTYQHKAFPPFTPGIEACGIIIEEKCNRKDLLNKKVIINKKGGCYSEEIIVNNEDIIIIPKKIDASIAAGFFIPYLTSYVSIIEIGNIKKNQKVLVTGSSGAVGSASLDILNKVKANIFPITSTIEKSNYIKNLIGKEPILYDKLKSNNFLKLKNSMDVVIDINGLLKNENILSSLKWGGKYIIIGFMKNNITKISTSYILIKGLNIYGIRAGEYLKINKKRKPFIIKKVLAYLIDNKPSELIFNNIAFSELKKGLFKLSNRSSMGKIIVKTRHYDE